MTSDRDPGSIRLGVRTRSLSDSRLRYIRQLGATDVFVEHADIEEEPDDFNDPTDVDTIDIGYGSIPSVEEFEAAKARVESHGLSLTGVHSLPYSLYGDIMFGRPGSEEALEQIVELVQNVGAADIPILGYQWNPRGLVPMRTEPVEIRGGAMGTAFDFDELEHPDELAPGIEREYTEEEFWEHYREFLETVLPVAESVDVKLAVHPGDPPVLESLGGIPRLLRSKEMFDKAMELVANDHHVLKLCLGCFSQMGEDVTEIIREFGERDQIGFIHFRDVFGTVPRFHETFVDEGNFDTVKVIKTLHEIGYDGAVLPDHVPKVEGDSRWRHRGRAFTIGYLRGVIDAVESQS